jgi:putative ABC transport system permease protein
MLKHYLRIAIRNMKNHKTYSFINIAGLSIGIACFFAIFLFVRFEMSYDNYHPDVDRIYRVAASVDSQNIPGEKRDFACISTPAAPAIKENFPQVEKAARFSIQRSVLIQYENKKFYESKFLSADQELFEIFSIPIIQGSQDDLLTRPGTIVITEDIAEKYFGTKNPVGKIIKADNDDFEITGVIKNPPRNTHAKFNFITSLDLNRISNYTRESWEMTIYYTYLKINQNTSVKSLENSINSFLKSKPGQLLDDWTYFLQPIKSIHLHSDLLFEVEPPGNQTYLYIFSVIGVFILLIASVNYINLTTARSAIRAKEVGVVKVIGAQKGQLIRQFLGESLLFSTFISIIAFCLVFLLLPFLSELTGVEFKKTDLLSSEIIIGFLVLACLTGVGSGIYPALLLSGFSPILTFKGLSRLGRTALRKYLVVFQFAVSVLLIISTLIVFFQLDFMKNANLGFDKEQKLCITANLSEYNYESIKNEFLHYHNVRGLTASSAVPGRGISGMHTRPKGKESSRIDFSALTVDYDFLSEYKLEITAGHDFIKGQVGSASSVCIINETGVKVLGLNSPENALENEVETENSDCFWNDKRIIGVVKDFHYRGLQHKIDPLMLILPETQDSYLGVLTLTVDTHNLPETLEFVENKWKELNLGAIFTYRFLDEDFDRLYKTEERVWRTFSTFTALGLFIAFFGLFGLALFTVEQRTKEIAIRKILGATISSILILLTKEFVKWVSIGTMIAFPIAYYAMDRWLQNFAYRIDIGWIPFAGAAVVAIVLSLFAVSLQTLNAAITNPVDSLRYE